MNTQEYNKISQAVNNWLSAKKEFEQEDQKFHSKKLKLFGITPGVYIVVIIVIYLIVSPPPINNKSKSSTESSENIQSGETIASNFILYLKPDINSEALGEFNEDINITIISSTNYFYSISFQKDNNIYRGFILKEKIKK